MTHKYPEPKVFDGSGITMHSRYRIVIQQPSCDDANILAATLANGYREKGLGISCVVEHFVAYVKDETGEVLGEIVVGRAAYLVPDQAAKQ